MSAYQAQPIRQYVHGAQLDEILSYRRRVDVGGVYTWETYYLQHGGQDTASRLMSESGLILEKYEYDPYGKATIYNGADVEVAFGNSKGLPFLWKSVHFDAETGLLYMRNRYYSTATGRFLSADPMGAWYDEMNAGNCYGYVGERVVVLRDPLGMQTEIGEISQWSLLQPTFRIIAMRGSRSRGASTTLPGAAGRHAHLQGRGVCRMDRHVGRRDSVVVMRPGFGKKVASAEVS